MFFNIILETPSFDNIVFTYHMFTIACWVGIYDFGSNTGQLALHFSLLNPVSCRVRVKYCTYIIGSWWKYFLHSWITAESHKRHDNEYYERHHAHFFRPFL